MGAPTTLLRSEIFFYQQILQATNKSLQHGWRITNPQMRFLLQAVISFSPLRTLESPQDFRVGSSGDCNRLNRFNPKDKTLWTMTMFFCEVRFHLFAHTSNKTLRTGLK
ncbi:MAG: hypothetical protein CFE38_05325 [Comamonadaceae bacterium PBBC1]|nr:MAG: hypothetical protein CFE38_05325 [Comamonadaceae bacterium PBBC1]